MRSQRVASEITERFAISPANLLARSSAAAGHEVATIDRRASRCVRGAPSCWMRDANAVPVSRVRKHRRPQRPRGGNPVRGVFNNAISESERIRSEVIDSVTEAIPAPCRRKVVTDPVSSQALLHSFREDVEAAAAIVASELDSYSWLFYLRRVPEELFAGRLMTTSPYRRAIAEALSTLSSRHQPFLEPTAIRQVIPPLSRGQAEAVIRLVHLAGALGTIHAAIRRAGKGQSIQWRSDELPGAVPDRELDDAIEVYDRRTERSQNLSAGTQVSHFYPFFRRVDPPMRAAELLLSVQPTPEPMDVPTWKGAARDPQGVHARQGRFIVGAESISPAVRLLATWAGNQWGSPQLSAIVLLLRGLFLNVWTSDWSSFSASMTGVGYLVVPTRSLPMILDEARKTFIEADLGLGKIALPDSGESAMQTLLAMRPSTWPLDPGPPLRQAGQQTVVDLRSASLWLERMLSISQSEPVELVKARSTHFEELVQRAIDDSRAAPPSDLRAMRGRDLRLNGLAITDVDALAVSGQVLLLVSCKSIVRTQELDAGVHARVRNVRTDLEKYDAFWVSRVDRLRANPKGDNYDFRGYEIHGVVCTPAVEFTHAPQLRRVLGDLRAVVSLDELTDFLSNWSAEPAAL